MAFILLVLIALVNRHTPFRGEHWAMLYAWVHGEDWFEKLSKVINIEYFGDHRFQPLNSMPMIAGYFVFGTSFLGNMFVSIFLQIFLALGVIRLISKLEGESAELSWQKLIGRYPFEFSFFLVLFPTMEVIFWTYFQYIQIATILTVFSVGWYLESSEIRERMKAYLFVVLAFLFYEPFLSVLAIYLMLNVTKLLKGHGRLVICDLLLPLSVCMIFGLLYLSGTVSKPVTIPPDVSYLNGILLRAGHDGIFQAPGAHHKLFFVLYNQILLFCHLAMSIFLPAYAHKTNLFEMVPIPLWVERVLPYGLVGLAVGLILIRRRFTANHWMLLSIVVTISAVIIWGRPGAGHYASTQFRYAYVVLPFLFVLVRRILLSFPLRPVAIAGLCAYLFTVNTASSILHGFRLENSFSPFARYISQMKETGNDSVKIIENTVKDLSDFKIPAPGYDVFLIYNGRGALGKFYKK